MSCGHLREAVAEPVPEAQECVGCRDEGRGDWVHLRLCLSCGYVGCCDSSPSRHATRHYTATTHPVMRSFEGDESWRWCYVDEALG
jgi:CPA1 family monovalent cation:H+ antiporter